MKLKIPIILSIVAVVLIVFAWLFSGMIKLYLPSSSKKAAIVAQEYVQNNFQQSMKYLGVDTIFEPAGYWVYFSPESKSDLKFYVFVSPEFTIYQDNYYSKYFEYQLETIFNGDVKALWSEDAYLTASMDARMLNADEPSLDEDINIEDAKDYLGNYTFLIVTKQPLETKAKQDEAKKILDTLQSIKSRGYEPYDVSFGYVESVSSRDIYFKMKKWKDITDAEQVLKCLE